MSKFVLVIEVADGSADLDDMESWAFGVMSRNTPPGNLDSWSIQEDE